MPFTLHQQHHIQTIMELVLLVVVQCLSWTSGSPIAMLHHATSSQSFLLHPQPSGSSSGGGGSPISGHSTSNQPRYEFKYEVSDHATGDRKSHWETREGDRVRGGYTLYEPDGAQRRVEYTADAQHGFNAIVTRNGQSKHFPPPRSSDYGAGYESSTRASGYLADRTSNRDLKYQTEVNEAPVGYSVTHVGQIKRPLDNEPY